MLAYAHRDVISHCICEPTYNIDITKRVEYSGYRRGMIMMNYDMSMFLYILHY